MDRYGGGGGYRDQSGDRRGGGDRYGGGGGGYRDRDASVDRRGGGRGGRGGGSSRGGPRSFGGDSFHKAAGGDYQRMPESVAHPTKTSEHQAYGTEGRPIELVSNFYRLMNKDVSVMHYDITISKVRISRGEVTSTTSGDDRDGPIDEKQQRLREIFIKKFADSIMAKFIANNSEVFQGASHAYDGWKNLYTNKKLNLGGGDEIIRQVELSICDRPATFNIKLQSVGRVSMGEAVDFYNGKSKTPVSEQVIAVFDIIFRFVIGKSYAIYQRKFFDLEDVESAPRVRLVDFVQGFISSVRSTEIGMALNVNLKTSAIISKQFNALMPFICEVIGVGPRDLQSISRQRCFQASKMIRHLKIFTNHSQRVVEYTVDALVDRFPQNETFDWKGRQVTYAEYFHEQYSVTLQKLPMVRVTKKNIHLPLELCLLKKGQFLNQSKIDGNIQREMLFKSTHTPNVYFHKVAQIINKIKEADTEHILADFGIDMDLRATRIEGRVLPTPRTLSANPRDRLYKSASMPPWGVFCFNETNYREDDLQRFVGQMRDSARAIGLNLPAPLVIKCLTVNSGLDIFNVFDNVSRSEMQMILIGLPSRNDSISPADMYNMVKHCCNQRFGLMNQCFSADKMLQLPGGYFNQFLLKVNAKIGGENSVIDPSVMARLPFNSATTMLVGLDVANVASDGDRLRPKVVAAVGSYNNTFTHYNAAIRVQATTDSDAIDDLEGMIKDLIKQYDAVNHCLPKNIVIFRSGLSDPQFDTVHSAESEMIRRAAQGIKIVYIVVQMRHNARFALSQQNTSSHKPTYNVPSGTVVDKGIVNPARRCFYLNSHFSPLGTSRPTKYTIMRDDLRLSADDVQKLCFYSCYNSCRTRNVISRPTPVRYADLLCQRSKNHLDAQRATEGDTFGGKTAASTGSLDMQEIQERVGRLNDMVMLHGNVKNALFYC